MLCSSIGSLAIKPANLPINITFCPAKSCKNTHNQYWGIIQHQLQWLSCCTNNNIFSWYQDKRGEDFKINIDIIAPTISFLQQYYCIINIIGPTISFQDLNRRRGDLNMRRGASGINQKQKLHSANSQNFFSADILKLSPLNICIFLKLNLE